MEEVSVDQKAVKPRRIPKRPGHNPGFLVAVTQIINNL
jgi:hypothetical protein